MADNVLIEGKPRIGWMIDGDSDTPEIAVMLESTGDSIILTIPTQGMFGGINDPYSRWFTQGIHYGDDPERTRYRYDPPRVLKFYDNLGTVMLVGCRARGMSSNMNAGVGRIEANYAVLGQHKLDLERINGIRTEMPALAAWTRISSTTRATTTDEANRVQELVITLRSPAETRLAAAKNLTICPTWRTSNPERGTLAAHDVVQLVTETQRKDSWDAQLRPHRSIQDLLSLSAWRAFGFSRIEAGTLQPPRPSVDSQVTALSDMNWSEVATHRVRLHEDWRSEPSFLFTYADIGPAGVRRWLKIRSRYERAMLPLIGIIDQRGMFGETRVLQTGISLEALGYQLAAATDPPTLNSRGQITYTDALDTVLADMPVVPVPDIEAWKARSRLSYMAVKHPDNPLPDVLTIANAYRENALVLRYWLAARLGCPASVLSDRLEQDPLGSDFIAG